jgi:hypothetical protein
MEVKTYGIGTKVYIDTFAGLLKGIVTDFPESLPGEHTRHIEVKITSRNNPVYKQGEILESSQNWVFPREVFRKSKRSSFGYYCIPYKWELK